MTKSPRPLPFGAALLAALLLASPALAKKAQSDKDTKEAKKAAKIAETPPPVDPTWLNPVSWREVGPYRGGRSAAVTGVVGQPNLYYFGATGGGVWRSTDAGASWKSVSDGFFGGSVGAVAVAESDPNVIYVGMGEKTVRGNVSHGDGMWKSVDAGATWKHVGLADSRHIPRVRIHPDNPDLVYAAVLGHLFGPNEERGVYRSKDGGATWQRILFANADAGAVDLILDPNNPRILYASTWRIRRTPYSLESGGEGSGLWKSTDGGDTWSELTRAKGLPKGTVGIIGIAVSPTNSRNLYVILEAEDGGVFRSRDGGSSWTRTSEDRALRQRAWYYSRIYADPADEDGVYVVNVGFHFSKDGGKTYRRIPTPHGDNHDLWIDPHDPLRMIQSNDGGANVSNDRGVSWSTQANQPTSQMYRVATDNATPYRILGGQQDNTSVRIFSRTSGAAIDQRDWTPSAGCESAHLSAKPDDPDIVAGGCYGGVLEIVNHRTGETRDVSVWPNDPMGAGAADLKYRFQWNFPIFFSQHDPNRLYVAANVLFQSDDLGQSWQAISPDLTRDDKSKMGSSGGPITKDNTSVEYYGTIFAATDSRHDKNVLWAGSDDGRLHYTKDGGGTWTEVTPKDLPEWSMINSVEVDPFEPGGLYIAATRYKLDDFAPYLYKTKDWGKTWTKIVAGIDPMHFTRALRADPGRKGLLYAGTEREVYVSFDDGGRWQSLQRNLPIVPITDLGLKNGDLIASTQGRGFWILDDLSSLHQVPIGKKAEKLTFLAPRTTTLPNGIAFAFPVDDAGKNPTPGVYFHYALPKEPAPDVEMSLEIFDSKGKTIRKYTRKPPEGDKSEAPHGMLEIDDDRKLTASAGLQRFVWDFNYNAAGVFPGMITWSPSWRPRAIPGKYRAKLTVGEESQEVEFELVQDRRSSSSQADLEAQLAFQLDIRDKLHRIHGEIARIRDVRAQLEKLETRLGTDEKSEAIRASKKALLEKMEKAEKELYQTQNRSEQDPLNFPIRLGDKLGGLMARNGYGSFRPTQSQLDTRAELYAQIDPPLATLDSLWKNELPALNAQIHAAQVPAIALEDPDAVKKPAVEK